MATTAVEGLAAEVKGRVVLQGDEGYDEARALYNAMIDKRPAAVAYCTDEADVAAAIQFARERGLRIAIRAGGHNGGGLGSVDDGLVVDLSAMNKVTVDAVRDRRRPLVDHRVVERARLVVSGVAALDHAPLYCRSQSFNHCHHRILLS